MAVALLPTINVEPEVRTKAVLGVCKTTGYDGDWGDTAAMWAWYRAQIIIWLKESYAKAKDSEQREALVPAYTFEDEITEAP